LVEDMWACLVWVFCFGEVGAWRLLVQHVGSDGWRQRPARGGHSGNDGTGMGNLGEMGIWALGPGD